MIIRPKDKKNIFISGVFLIVLLSITALSIFTLSKDSSMFSQYVTLHTMVENVQNLKDGAAVHLKGMKIGSVSKIKFESVDQIKISINIKNEFLQWIKKDSYISFRTQGVLGDKMLEILGGGSTQESLNNDDFIILKKDSQIDKFINKGEDILLVANRVLIKIDKVLGEIEDDKLSKILENMDKSSSRLATILEDVQIKKTMQSVQHAAKSIAGISKQVKEGPGTLHSMIYDQSLHDDLKTLIGGSNRNKVLKYFIRESIRKSEK